MNLGRKIGDDLLATDSDGELMILESLDHRSFRGDSPNISLIIHLSLVKVSPSLATLNET